MEKLISDQYVMRQINKIAGLIDKLESLEPFRETLHQTYYTSLTKDERKTMQETAVFFVKQADYFLQFVTKMNKFWGPERTKKRGVIYETDEDTDDEKPLEKKPRVVFEDDNGDLIDIDKEEEEATDAIDEKPVTASYFLTEAEEVNTDEEEDAEVSIGSNDSTPEPSPLVIPTAIVRHKTPKNTPVMDQLIKEREERVIKAIQKTVKVRKHKMFRPSLSYNTADEAEQNEFVFFKSWFKHAVLKDQKGTGRCILLTLMQISWCWKIDQMNPKLKHLAPMPVEKVFTKWGHENPQLQLQS